MTAKHILGIYKHLHRTATKSIPIDPSQNKTVQFTIQKKIKREISDFFKTNAQLIPEDYCLQINPNTLLIGTGLINPYYEEDIDKILTDLSHLQDQLIDKQLAEYRLTDQASCFLYQEMTDDQIHTFVTTQLLQCHNDRLSNMTNISHHSPRTIALTLSSHQNHLASGEITDDWINVNPVIKGSYAASKKN